MVVRDENSLLIYCKSYRQNSANLKYKHMQSFYILNNYFQRCPFSGLELHAIL